MFGTGIGPELETGPRQPRIVVPIQAPQKFIVWPVRRMNAIEQPGALVDVCPPDFEKLSVPTCAYASMNAPRGCAFATTARCCALAL